MAAPDNHAAPQHGDAARDVPATPGKGEEAAENRPEAGDAFSVVVDVLRLLWIQALGSGQGSGKLIIVHLKLVEVLPLQSRGNSESQADILLFFLTQLWLFQIVMLQSNRVMVFEMFLLQERLRK